ncbi:unnamed protein product [Strongylus vulgaris]|uniref:Uncharacterized protein n=1 Tax=Strongylus vulgaris TaxID=40348 RepID=A0A3P7JEL6_STRVU|nr:unnamed protein product [Strongylus vulgaris]
MAKKKKDKNKKQDGSKEGGEVILMLRNFGRRIMNSDGLHVSSDLNMHALSISENVAILEDLKAPSGEPTENSNLNSCVCLSNRDLGFERIERN